LFAAGSFAGSTNTSIRILNDSINIYWGGAGGPQWTATAVLRDPSAWYHLVFAFDTTQATFGNRLKLYVNGVQSTVWSLQETGGLTAQNSDLYINNNQQHNLGASGTPGNYFDGYMTEVNFIDGQALTPSSFGETDSATGVWKPKVFSGTYGTNGFYLPFKTASQWSGFFDGTGDKLTSSTNAIAATGEFSVEAWVYQTARTVTSDQHIFSQYTSGATAGRWYLRFNGTTVAFTTGLGTSVSCATTVNTGTWYHVCVTRDSSNRVRVFLNGVLDGTAVISGSLDTAASTIGATQTANYWQGYISNVRAVSGQIPTAYQTSSTTVGASIFTPSTSQLTAVSGTSLLTCQSSTFVDNSGLSRTITTAGDVITQQFSPFTLDVTDDHSGQGNHWIPNNLDLRTTGVGADIMVDVPTSYGTDTGVGGEVRGNYCTLNPLDKTAAVTLSNGNLQALLNGINYFAKSTIAISSGKWYWEVTASATAEDMIGITKADVATTGYFGSQATSYGYYKTNGNKFNSATGTAYGATYASGDIIGVALDLDAGTLTYYKNGVSQGTAFTGLSGTFFAGVSTAGTGGTQTINFGQRAFAYTAPSGFKALCTQNLPPVTIGATSTTQANDYMNVVTYTATPGTGATISGVGFQPDLLWVKNRDNVEAHYWQDSVRGFSPSTNVTKMLKSNSTAAESSLPDITCTTTSDGFTVVDSSPGVDEFWFTNRTYVGWCWKANGAGSSNTDGQITSTVSVNTTSKFSIVTYTGNGSANQTVGHGLGVVPTFGILKDRDTNSNNDQWQVFHTGSGDNYAYLSTTAAFTGTAQFYPTTASSTTVTVGRDVAATTNESGDRFVMYLFADVDGYSKAFSYASNNSADNAFVYLGFRPRWIMIKSESAGGTNLDWVIYDTARMTYNYIANTELRANLTTTEGGLARNPPIDILSNGFKVRGSGGEIGSSTLYVGMAFAETPFKYSLAR